MRHAVHRLAVLLVLLQVLFAATVASAQIRHQEMVAGWYSWDPYQYEATSNGVTRLTGLDIELLRAIFEEMGYDVKFDPVSWEEHQKDLAAGTRDVAGGAFMSQARQAFAYYSEPYRTEKDYLYVRRTDRDRFDADTAQEIMARLDQPDVRVGAVRGFYYGPQMMAFLNDPANADRILWTQTDGENFENLMAMKIDVFPIDHLAAATQAWRRGLQPHVRALKVPIFEGEIHAIFSKASVEPEVVHAFNDSLARIQASGQYNQIMRQYLLPVLLSATAGQRWFFLIDIIGTVAFALSGVILARQGGYSLFGALVLAAVPSVGGGIVRDILIGRETLGVLTTPAYLLAILITVLTFYIIFRIPFGKLLGERAHVKVHQDPHLVGKIGNNTFVAFSDALGLSAFAIIGVVVAVEHNVEPLWLWGPLLAAMTGAGGGILRDVIRADVDNPGLKGSFYAEVALIWGLFLSLSLTWYADQSEYDPNHLTALIVFTLLGALATRMVAFFYKIRSPMF